MRPRPKILLLHGKETPILLSRLEQNCEVEVIQHPQRDSLSLKSRLADDGSLLDAMILHDLDRGLMLDLCSDFRQCPSGTDGVIIELTLGRNLLTNVADHSINAEESDAIDQIENAMTIAAA